MQDELEQPSFSAAEAQRVPRHGLAVPRGQEQLPGLPGPAGPPGAHGGRFGHMFDVEHGRRLGPDDDAIEVLAKMVIRSSGRSGFNGNIPAGYTYLGQFIDHDITFDPTSKLQRDNDPDALVNFRTPRFDLDSLYGSGPVDQPFLYDWSDSPQPGVKLLVGANPPGDDSATVDLPRNQQGRALVGDARNDENLIVSQLHLLFIHFHNKVVDLVSARPQRLGRKDLLEEAQRIVRWHYQWVVIHDFLPKVVGKEMADSVLRPAAGDAAPTVDLKFFSWRGEPFMPVEFSAAAFRFGHSMVRDTYRLNRTPGVPIFRRDGEQGRHLGGLRRLPDSLRIEWKRFFVTTPTSRAASNTLMDSMRIDASLSPRLTHIPPRGQALARLNLERGRALGLPAGPDVADAMNQSPLTETQLKLGGIDATTRKALVRGTPLWYYVLRDAAVNGAGGLRLGPVGGRIVAEVLVGLLDADPSSYLRQSPPWTPELPKAGDDFTMADIVRFTLGHDEQ